MSKKLIIPKEIVTVDSEGRILQDHCIILNENIIEKITPLNQFKVDEFEGDVIRREKLTLIPGFVQTHIHLCQTLFRGLADDLELLDWLQQKIFPFENAHNKDSVRISAKLGINELLRGGTTTLLDMGTLNHNEATFEELIFSGMRGFSGKCMIDLNELYSDFKSTTKSELEITYQFAKEFHNSSNGKIKYGFAPRFVLSCSEELLKDTREMMGDFDGSIFHTHSSENKNEIEEVRKRFGKENIEYFDSANLLDDHSVLAHCIHVNEPEIGILKNKNVRVAHCPSSNLKLGSGIAQIPRYLKEGISVSLGADGAPCNNNLDAFVEMRLAALIQKPIHSPKLMNAETVFRLATIEGAKALHLEKEIGSIEVGKKADLVFLELETPYHSLSDDMNDIYSKIVYSSFKQNVTDVMIDGEFVVEKGESLIYDQQELYSDGKNELKKLLDRI